MTLVELLGKLDSPSRQSQTLVALYYGTVVGQVADMTAAQLKGALVASRAPRAKNANVADILSKCGEYVDYTTPKAGARLWRLTGTGIEHVRSLVGIPETHIEKKHDVQALTDLVVGISSPEVRKYFEEAIVCLRAGALRACIVFVWTGVISTVRERMFAKGLPALNAALVRHYQKCKTINSLDDFAYVPDNLLLLAAQDLQLFDKSQKTILEHGLDLRNHSGHPAKYDPGGKKASSFIEDMLSIVFGIKA